MSLEDIVKSLATNTLQFQQETRASIQNLDTQVGQMATAISRLEAQGSGKLPSQTVVNPKENASAITLRNGRELEIPEKSIPTPKEQSNVDEGKEEAINGKTDSGDESDESAPKRKFPPLSEYKPVPPFPLALTEKRKIDKYSDLFETFRKCEVNIPLFDAIKQVPRYAKFLKELCTHKRKQELKRYEKVKVGKNVSAVIQRKLPTKCQDPGMFTIPCTIGSTRFEKAMLDLGASINVMPYSIYASLSLEPLSKTGTVIQLADGSNVNPRGVVEDVLVQVNGLIFSADFYVLDMENGGQNAPILLGRPFLKTSKTKIDVHSGTLSMEFDGEIVKFNIDDTMKSPSDDKPVYSIDVTDSLAQEDFDLEGKDDLEIVLSKNIDEISAKSTLNTDLQETVEALNDAPKLGNIFYVELPVSDKKSLPSVLQSMKLSNGREECFRDGVVNDAVKDESNDDSYFLLMDEDEFEDFHLYNDAEEFNEKSKWQHEKTICVFEPD